MNVNVPEAIRAFRELVFDFRLLISLAAVALITWAIPINWLPDSDVQNIAHYRGWAEIICIAACIVALVVHGAIPYAKKLTWERAIKAHLTTLNLNEIHLIAILLASNTRTVEHSYRNWHATPDLCGKEIFAKYENGSIQIPEASWKILQAHKEQILSDPRLPEKADTTSLKRAIDEARQQTSAKKSTWLGRLA